MTRRSLVILGLTAVVVGSCTTSRPEDGRVAERECVNSQNIYDYDVLDDHHVVVEARSNDYYLLTLQEPCSGLAFARGIAIADAMTRVCGDGSAWVSFDQAIGGSKRCRIIGVERVGDTEEAEAIIQSRGDDEHESP
ncbi:MAG TPA: DUF6491 family protein [Thermoanaerobaculia bacterium]|nr:DUF6491 family protein [Thermoanaerobaculia bacterium]